MICEAQNANQFESGVLSNGVRGRARTIMSVRLRINRLTFVSCGASIWPFPSQLPGPARRTSASVSTSFLEKSTRVSDPFVVQLGELCRAHVTRAKWVFVPSHAIGRTLGERIALDGTNWLNLRFVTPLDIALRMGAPFLVERGIDPSEEGLGPALMMRLLLDLPEKDGYFRPLADQPTMAQALWTTIRELRMAGVKSADLKPEAFESPAKHAELRALLAAYEQFLSQNNRGDMAVVYEEAVKHPDWCPIQPEDCWTELPDAIWTPLQRG